MLELLSNLIEITQMFRHNVLRYGLILAIDHVHVQLAFAALDQRTQIARVHQTTLQRFQEYAESGQIDFSYSPLVSTMLSLSSQHVLAMPLVDCFHIAENHALLAAAQIFGHHNVTVRIADLPNVPVHDH